jgi:hypothetical protein
MFFFYFQDLMMMMLSLLLSSHLMMMERLTVKGKHYIFPSFKYSSSLKFPQADDDLRKADGQPVKNFEP